MTLLLTPVLAPVHIRHPVLHAVLMLLLCAGTPPAFAAPGVEYIAAQRVDGPALRYPEEARVNGREALVLFYYVVDAQGEVTDVQIDYTTGYEVIERHLRKWARQQTFKPAMRNGVAVDSRVRQQATFLLTQRTRGASREFGKEWKRFKRSIDDGNLPKARKHIDIIAAMEGRSLYEELFLQRAWALYHSLNQDDDQAYSYLRTIAGFHQANSPSDETIAPPSTFSGPIIEKYNYEVQHLMLGDAAQSLQALREIDAGAGEIQGVESHYASIVEAVEGKQFWTEGVITTYPFSRGLNRWSTRLTRRRFAFRQIDGEITAATVSCERGGSIELEIAVDVEVETEDARGDCELLVTGESGASFIVAQFSDGSS